MKAKDGKIGIKLPARASAWYLISSALTKGVGVVATPLFTRLLSGEAYGEFTLYMTLLGGATVVCSAFNSGSAIYKGLKKNENERYAYLRATLGLSVAFSLILCLLLFAFSPFLELNPVFYIPLSLQLLCDSTTAVYLSSERFYYKYKSVAAIGAVNAVLPPAISAILLIKTDLGYPVRIYSLLFVSLLIAVFSLLRLFRGHLRERRKSSFIKEAVQNSMPMLPHSVSSAISVQSDKLIISSLMGSVALGRYSVIYSAGAALQFVVTAIGSALSPWIIRRLEANEGDRIASLISPMLLGYGALSLCLIAIAPEAIAILAPSEYSEAMPALMPIALSTPFYFISTTSTVGIVYSGRTGYSIIISAVGAVLSVILNYTLTSAFGYLGAGIAVLLCQAAGALLGIAMLSRTAAGGMIKFKPVALVTLIIIPIGALISSLHKSIAARALLLVIPTVMLLYCLKKAKGLVLENR